MTRARIEASAGHKDPDEFRGGLYLEHPDIAELLAYVKEHATQPFVYPLVTFAAHTGERRSEMLRALVTDVDFTGKTVLVREKKRVRGQQTTMPSRMIWNCPALIATLPAPGGTSGKR